jgi:hypothetical protein
MMQYLAIVLAFVMVLVTVWGPIWDSNRQHLTKFGWLTIAVAFAIMLVSLYTGKRQASQRMTARTVAQAELREALDQVLHPFAMLWMNADLKINNKLAFNEGRFYGDSAYMVAKLREPFFREAWSHFDLRRDPEYPSLYPSSTWWQFFSEKAARADSKFESCVAKYSAYLDAEELLEVHALQSDEFFRMRMKDLPTLVEANAHLKEYPVSFAFRGHNEDAEYLHFVDKVGVLARRLPPNPFWLPSK